jgi:hypothetical protein
MTDTKSQPLRLFSLRKWRKGPVITDQFDEPVYYSNKMEAKIVRDRIKGTTVVSYGPDHHLYEA